MLKTYAHLAVLKALKNCVRRRTRYVYKLTITTQLHSVYTPAL